MDPKQKKKFHVPAALAVVTLAAAAAVAAGCGDETVAPGHPTCSNDGGGPQTGGTKDAGDGCSDAASSSSTGFASCFA